MKYMAILSYDGSKFKGFQRQNNVRNVQGEIEQTLSKILEEEIVVKGAGRTDALVHARYQVIHFETTKKINGLRKLANKNLKDIKIRKIKKVQSDFHARHSALSKTYLYKIDLTGKKDSNYYGKVKRKLDVTKMKKASKVFLGTHDFRNFVAGDRLNYQTTISKIRIYKLNKVLYLEFTGTAFYRYMIRNLVGALVEVGKGKVGIEKLQDMLDLKLDKKLPTFSPNGLYLIKIRYPD